jgi:hypothetical protein
MTLRRMVLFLLTSTNNNKDIVVVDKTSCDTGSVVVVGWDGGLRWTYKGNYKINVTTQFDPNDVVTTTTGHIKCEGSTTFYDTYYNIIVTGHMDSHG